MVDKKNLSVDVVVAGHRDLFGTPRALEQAGLLRHLVTDLYVGKGSWLSPIRPLLPFGPKLLRKLLARDSGLPANKIVANNLAGLIAWRDLRKANGPGDAAAVHQQLSAQLASSLLKLKPPADVVVGYRGSGALFKSMHSNVSRVLCQNDGGSHEVRISIEEHAAFPEWTTSSSPRLPHTAHDWLDQEAKRLIEEWACSDRIVCWSEWTKECVRESGGDEQKCVILPPTFSPSQRLMACTPQFESEEFRIGFLGTLCIRKGTHRLIIAAKRLRDSGVPIKICLAGVNQFNPHKLAEYEDVIEYLGLIPHSELPNFFESVQCLCLPSISEGLAMVQLEAMSSGLPVICTDRCGGAVRNGVDGIVISSGSTDALEEALRECARNRGQLQAMSANARKRVDHYSLDQTASRWQQVVFS